MDSSNSVALMNAEINKELADPSVGRALLATTFKGLNAVSMKQAALEGLMRGFKFKDFLEKNVYAIPYANTYSLVTSIDYARKRGMKSGIIGKDAPVFVMDGKGIVSCSVTVRRRVGKDIGQFTAEVYFDEYDTGKNLWKSKPRTMIAKVAEMHALRMACPEELSQIYTEEEFQSEQIVREPLKPYVVERATAHDDDEPWSHQPQEEVVEAVPEAAEETKPISLVSKTSIHPQDTKKLRFEIAKLLKEKGDFTMLGKSHEKISDKIFDLVGMAFTEDNYPEIITALEELK